jgi:putative phosphoesterase
MQALVYDVHGNLPALEAVLQDAGDVDRFILGGDFTLFGGWPLETIERLRELPALWIRGNGERWTADPADTPENPILPGAIEAARGALGSQLVADLASLPFSATDGDTLICHGSPVSDVRSFAPEPGPEDEELLDRTTATRLIFGHTHLPFARTAHGIELINPGSVGLPFDGDTRAAYALIHDDGTVEHRRVTYDHHASAAKLRASGGDWAETVARRIEQARAGA